MGAGGTLRGGGVERRVVIELSCAAVEWLVREIFKAACDAAVHAPEAVRGDPRSPARCERRGHTGLSFARRTRGTAGDVVRCR